MLTRRRFLRAAGLVAALSAVKANGRRNARAAETADGFRILRARPGSAHLRGPDQPSTAILGYDGALPGPVLRIKRGDELRVRLINELPDETTIHWHGARVPNANDGVPRLTQPPVPPGGTFDYRFTARDAGTFWYHPPSLVSDQLARGLCGALIVDEPEPVGVDRDVLLMVNDWRLDGVPQHLTVNAQPSLDIPVAANERVRLRLVNASAARPMSLRFDKHRITVMAIDGQPAEPFVARDSRVGLGPGNRLDLFVDMTLAAGATAPMLVATQAGEMPLARFVYASAPPLRDAPLPDPKPLPANPLPQRIELRNAHRVELSVEAGARGWTEARTASAYGPPLFSVKRGRTVVLALINRTAVSSIVHLHGHHVRLLDNLDDGWKPFWLDTIMAAAQQTARVAFVADNPGKWLIGCRVLDPGDAGRVAWFEVT